MSFPHKFKYIFKVSEKTKISDIFQIFIIIILLVFIIFLSIPFGIIISSNFNHDCSPCGYLECRAGFKKALAAINQSVSLEKELNNKVSYENANDFGLILTKRLNLIEIYNVKNVDIKESDKIRTMNKKDIKKYNLSEYEGKPILVQAVGITYMISKFEQGCKNVDLNNPDNCSCLIDADLNGFNNKPNDKTGFTPKRNKNDRYTFVIDGNSNQILPLKIYHNYME